MQVYHVTLSCLPAFAGGDDLHAKLPEIDENLIRANLSPAQEAQAVARRKAIYETLHPETKHGGNGGGPSGTFCHTDKSDFTAATAKATGKAERTIRVIAARGKALRPELSVIAGTSLDKTAELDALARIKPAERTPLIERARAGEGEADLTSSADVFFNLNPQRKNRSRYRLFQARRDLRRSGRSTRVFRRALG